MTRLMPYQNTGLRPCQARGQDMLVADPSMLRTSAT